MQRRTSAPPKLRTSSFGSSHNDGSTVQKSSSDFLSNYESLQLSGGISWKYGEDSKILETAGPWCFRQKEARHNKSRGAADKILESREVEEATSLAEEESTALEGEDATTPGLSWEEGEDLTNPGVNEVVHLASSTMSGEHEAGNSGRGWESPVATFLWTEGSPDDSRELESAEDAGNSWEDRTVADSSEHATAAQELELSSGLEDEWSDGPQDPLDTAMDAHQVPDAKCHLHSGAKIIQDIDVESILAAPLAKMTWSEVSKLSLPEMLWGNWQFQSRGHTESNESTPAAVVEEPSPPAKCSSILHDKCDPEAHPKLFTRSHSTRIKAENIIMDEDENGRPIVLSNTPNCTVYTATLNGITEVALKQFHGTYTNIQQADILREMAILRSCRHRNVVRLHGVCIVEDKIALISEFLDSWSLFDALKSQQKDILWYKRGLRIAIDVARGLCMLHSRKIIHSDLRSSNIHLTSDGVAKIGDAGLTITPLLSHAYNVNAWTAPEIFIDGSRNSSEKVDMYGFGVILWELVTGEQPRRNRLRDSRVPEECPPEVEELMQRCLSFQPQERPSCREALDLLLWLDETLHGTQDPELQHCSSAHTTLSSDDITLAETRPSSPEPAYVSLATSA